MFNFFKKNRVPCPVENNEECHYNHYTECQYDKKNCILKMEEKEKRKGDKTPWKIAVFIITGLLLYIIFFMLKHKYENQGKDCVILVCEIIAGVSLSVIAGAILTYIIDIPSKLKEYETSFLNALSSNNYLKSLDETRLIQLRKDTTKQLHTKNTPHMAKGLIEIDQRICNLLNSPYYTRYRQTIKCSDIENDSTYIIKEHMIDYCLKNPYGLNKTAVEYIGLKNLILRQGKEGTFIENLKIEYKIDDDDDVKTVSSESYKLVESELNKNIEFYDTQIQLYGVGEGDTQQDSRGIKISFTDHLEVHMEFKIKVPKDDICFSKRLRHPAKYFRIDYAHSNQNIKLYGQIFGTELKQSDMSIKYMADNFISLETFDWLLPRNGAIIVMTEKKDVQQ